MSDRVARNLLNATARWRHLAVGLYGGSFNPAHVGHRHVARKALRMLDLDVVWWLVSPQNPLKDVRGMAPFDVRFEGATRCATHPAFFVTDLEQRLAINFTVETIRALRIRYRATSFIWIMGADAFAGLHLWRGWREIMNMVCVAVVGRPGYSRAALLSPAARKFKRFQLGEGQARELKHRRAPAWVFLRGPLHPASATALRDGARGPTGRE